MNAKGTGLGLSICKNIIEQMGGSVQVLSELGKGSRFQINLNALARDKGASNQLERNSQLQITDSFSASFRKLEGLICGQNEMTDFEYTSFDPHSLNEKQDLLMGELQHLMKGIRSRLE